jgi:hypothetical protein
MPEIPWDLADHRIGRVATAETVLPGLIEGECSGRFAKSAILKSTYGNSIILMVLLKLPACRRQKYTPLLAFSPLVVLPSHRTR